MRITIVLAVAVLSGCASPQWVTLRGIPRNPLGDELQLTSRNGPQPTPRTMQLLRVYNLNDALQGDPRTLLENLQRITEQEPSADKVYAMSELAYLSARKIEKQDKARALDLYGAAVLHAYAFLFDDRLAATRNCYDPQFRGACDLYNSALESALRLSCNHGELRPGTTKTIHTATGTWDITCVLRGGVWQPDDFDHFEFVSDYEMKGLKNHYQSHGLGVPLIVVRRSYKGEPEAARFYPPGLSFPVTAFLRPVSGPNQAGRNQGLLELCDPLEINDTRVGHVLVPLESDLTTPLAYFLSKVPMESLATVGLFQPEQLLLPHGDQQTMIKGLYMVQPYEPGKIPVVFIHGMWSSPMTWMEMFNDLRSSPDIRQHYQFWFYLYPTGQPFWLSAAQLRRDLPEARQVLDPQHREPALDQMVLVGHSMGGLVARLQTLESGQDFWKLASRIPWEQVKADPDVKQKLGETFYFHPNPSIRRVVTIATPHGGSTFSNQTTQYLLDKLIRLPETIVNAQQQLFRDNPDMLFPESLLKIETSVDSLSPKSPILSVMQASPRAPWVKYNNIIGQVPESSWLHTLADHTDGVVTVDSARSPDAEPALIVPDFHLTVHSHPLAVLEVRRILQEHLDELRGHPVVGLRLLPPVR
ncbi:MAG: esterase/lipase family protein [Thermoguttaceae bacterium]